MNALYKLIAPGFASSSIPQSYKDYLAFASSHFFSILAERNLYSGANLDNIKTYSLDLNRIMLEADEYAAQRNLQTVNDFAVKAPAAEVNKARSSVNFLLDKIKNLSLMDKIELAPVLSELMSKASTLYNQNKAIMGQSSIQSANDLIDYTALIIFWLIQIYPSVMLKPASPPPEPQKQPADSNVPPAAEPAVNLPPVDAIQQKDLVEPELIGPPIYDIPLPGLVEERVIVSTANMLKIDAIGNYWDMLSFINNVIGYNSTDNSTELAKAIIAIGFGLKLGVDLNSIYNKPSAIKLEGIDILSPSSGNQPFLFTTDETSLMQFKGDRIVLNMKNISNVFSFMYLSLPGDLVIKRALAFTKGRLGKDIAGKLDSVASKLIFQRYFQTDKYPTGVILQQIKEKNPLFTTRIIELIQAMYMLCCYALSGIRDLSSFMLLASQDSINLRQLDAQTDEKAKKAFFDIAIANSQKKLIVIPSQITATELYTDCRIAYKLFLSDKALVDILSLLDGISIRQKALSGDEAKASTIATQGNLQIAAQNLIRIDQLQYTCLQDLIANRSKLDAKISNTVSLFSVLTMLPSLDIRNKDAGAFETVFKNTAGMFNNWGWDEALNPTTPLNAYSPTQRNAGIRQTEYSCSLDYLVSSFDLVNQSFMQRFPSEISLIDVLRAVFKRTGYQSDMLMYQGRFGSDEAMVGTSMYLNPTAYYMMFIFSLYVVQCYAEINCKLFKQDTSEAEKKEIADVIRGQSSLLDLYNKDIVLKLAGLAAIAFTASIVIKRKSLRK